MRRKTDTRKLRIGPLVSTEKPISFDTNYRFERYLPSRFAWEGQDRFVVVFGALGHRETRRCIGPRQWGLQDGAGGIFTDIWARSGGMRLDIGEHPLSNPGPGARHS